MKKINHKEIAERLYDAIDLLKRDEIEEAIQSLAFTAVQCFGINNDHPQVDYLSALFIGRGEEIERLGNFKAMTDEEFSDFLEEVWDFDTLVNIIERSKKGKRNE